MSERQTVDTVTLFRPTGETELALIRASGWREFPHRLPEQPIFYPVLTVEAATQIAYEWTTHDGGTVYVLRFDVEFEYLKQFPIQAARLRIHQEYWIPAEDLPAFNAAIVGPIEVVAEFHG